MIMQINSNKLHTRKQLSRECKMVQQILIDSYLQCLHDRVDTVKVSPI